MERARGGITEEEAPVEGRVLFIGKYLAPPDLERIVALDRRIRFLYDLVLQDDTGASAKFFLHPDRQGAVEQGWIRQGSKVKLVRVENRLDPLRLGSPPFPVLAELEAVPGPDLDEAVAEESVSQAAVAAVVKSDPLLATGADYMPLLSPDLLPYSAHHTGFLTAWALGLPLSRDRDWPTDPLPEAELEGLPPVRSLGETLHKRLGTQSVTLVGRVLDKSPLIYFGQPTGSEQDHPYFFNFFLHDRGACVKAVVWNALARRVFHALHTGDVVAVAGFRTKLRDGAVELALNAQRPEACVLRVKDDDVPRYDRVLAPEPTPLVCTSQLLPILPAGSRVHLVGLVVRVGPIQRESGSCADLLEALRGEAGAQGDDEHQPLLAEPALCTRWIELRDPHSGTAVTARVATNSSAAAFEQLRAGQIVHLSDMATVAFAAGGRCSCYLAPTQAARCTVLAESDAQAAAPGPVRGAVADVAAWAQGWEEPRYISAPSIALGLPHTWSPSLKPVVALPEAHALLGRPGESLPVLKLSELARVSRRMHRYQRLVALCRVRVDDVASWPQEFRGKGSRAKRRKGKQASTQRQRRRRGGARGGKGEAEEEEEEDGEEEEEEEEEAGEGPLEWPQVADLPPATGFVQEAAAAPGRGRRARRRGQRSGADPVWEQEAPEAPVTPVGGRDFRRAWVGGVASCHTLPEPVVAVLTVSPCGGADEPECQCLVGVPQRFAVGAQGEELVRQSGTAALAALLEGVGGPAAGGASLHEEQEEEDEGGEGEVDESALTRSQRQWAERKRARGSGGEEKNQKGPWEEAVHSLKACDDVALCVEVWQGSVPQVHFQALGLFKVPTGDAHRQ